MRSRMHIDDFCVKVRTLTLVYPNRDNILTGYLSQDMHRKIKRVNKRREAVN